MPSNNTRNPYYTAFPRPIVDTSDPRPIVTRQHHGCNLGQHSRTEEPVSAPVVKDRTRAAVCNNKTQPSKKSGARTRSRMTSNAYESMPDWPIPPSNPATRLASSSPSAWTSSRGSNSHESSAGKATGLRSPGASLTSRSTSATSDRSHRSLSPFLRQTVAVPPRISSRQMIGSVKAHGGRMQVPTLCAKHSEGSPRVRRKPVPAQPRPRPSSPTLHALDFTSSRPPRSAPSVPFDVTPVNPDFGHQRAANMQPKSFWDLDSEDESDSDDEMVGLVNRMKSGLNIRRVSRGNADTSCATEKLDATKVDVVRRREIHSQRVRHASWSERLFCGR